MEEITRVMNDDGNEFRKLPYGNNFAENLENSISLLRNDGVCLIPKFLHIKIPNARNCLYAVVEKLCQTRKPQWRPEHEQVAEWLADNESKGLLLTGKVGAGKSFMAERVIPIIIHMNYDVIVKNIYKSYMLNSMYEEVIKYKRLLVIDDLGMEGERVDYGNRRMVFPEIVDLAEERGTLLIITTNLSAEMIGKKYGERTVSRLKELTRCIIFKGDDIRGTR